MAQQTLLDIAKLNGNDAVVGLIEENHTFAPETLVIPARTIKGTSFRTVSRTTYPGVGFRAANGGVTYTKSSFLNRNHECFILSGNVRADVAIMSAYEDGPEAFKAIETMGVGKQALIDLGSQTIYGIAADALGFPGLQALHTAFSAELTARGITNLTVDAGGTTANTGTSVYGISTGTDGLQYIFGNGVGLTLSDWFRQMVNDGTAGQDYLAECASLNAWVGLQAANPYCIGRLKDATADSGMGVTDAKLADLLRKYPIGYRPKVWLMNRDGAYQLQSSRSATSVTNSGQKAATGMDIFAPLPVEACGIPIVITDSIVSTEALS